MDNERSMNLFSETENTDVERDPSVKRIEDLQAMNGKLKENVQKFSYDNENLKAKLKETKCTKQGSFSFYLQTVRCKSFFYRSDVLFSGIFCTTDYICHMQQPE